MTREWSTPQRKIVDMSKQQGLSFLPFSFSGLIKKYEEAFGPISEEVTRIGSDFIFVDVVHLAISCFGFVFNVSDSQENLFWILRKYKSWINRH